MKRKRIIGIFLLILIVVSSSIVSFFIIYLFNNPYDPPSIGDAFRSQWDTTKTSAGSSNNKQVHLPLVSEGNYDFTVDWGDGTSSIITRWDQAEVTHTYFSSGNYTINITGLIIGWSFNDTGDKLKLLVIEEWGKLQLGNSGGYFSGCKNLKITASDVLSLIGTTTLVQAFQNCESLDVVNGMNEWDTSNITDMSSMFYNAKKFNQPIGNWNVSKVENMSYLFCNATYFNQDIGSWNVSKVEDMSYMFFKSYSFFQNISSWNVSNVGYMDLMFSGCTISTVVYDSILIEWSKLNLRSNVTFDAGNTYFSSEEAEIAKQKIMDDFDWDILDSGDATP